MTTTVTLNGLLVASGEAEDVQITGGDTVCILKCPIVDSEGAAMLGGFLNTSVSHLVLVHDGVELSGLGMTVNYHIQDGFLSMKWKGPLS